MPLSSLYLCLSMLMNLPVHPKSVCCPQITGAICTSHKKNSMRPTAARELKICEWIAKWQFIHALVINFTNSAWVIFSCTQENHLLVDRHSRISRMVFLSKLCSQRHFFFFFFCDYNLKSSIPSFARHGTINFNAVNPFSKASLSVTSRMKLWNFLYGAREREKRNKTLDASETNGLMKRNNLLEATSEKMPDLWSLSI